MRHIRKNKPSTETPVILYDTQENFPWKFLSPRFKMIRKRLKTGDYTFENYEDKVTVEKKSGLSELLCNLTAKERPRFKRFLYRLSKFPIKVLIIEDDPSNAARALMLAKKKSNGRCQLTPDTIPFWLARITVKYGIPVLFVGNIQNSRKIIMRVFEEVWLKCQE